MKQLYILAGAIFAAAFCRAQGPSLSISPDPTLHAQCPGVELTYLVKSWASGCHTLGPLVNGTLIAEKPSGMGRQLFIRWEDSPEPGTLTVLRSDSAACTPAAPGTSWEIPIASVAGLAPVIMGPTEVPVLPFPSPVYMAGLTHHQSGSLDPDPFPVTNFEWKVPDTWSYFFPDFTNSAIITVLPDTSQGCLMVRGQRACGALSEWTTLCPERFLPSPCPMFLSQTTIPCGQTPDIFASVSDFSFFIPDIKYTWIVSDGWELLGNPVTSQTLALVKPDGLHSGTVSVTISGAGLVSEPCTVTIPYIPDFMDTRVTGPDEVCTNAKFYLSDLPPNATSSWEVKPLDPGAPNPFNPTSGTGYQADLSLTNADAGGSYVITFRVADACGEVTKEKTFYAGKPRFFSSTVDNEPSLPAVLCPGAHRIGLNAEGDDGCIDWSVTSGVPGYADCRHFDFIMPETGNNCLTISAISSNLCGSREQDFHFCTENNCGDAGVFDLKIYPNPGDFIVTMEGISSRENESEFALIEALDIYNALGQLVYTWTDAPRRLIVLPVRQIPKGVYVVNARIWGKRIIKTLLVAEK